ncbi:MAG: hypothetical protein EOL87_13600 [Spartobacteria bacterium]|nr:hypothetical protein [Spartobacteria bacterium]
MKKEWLLCCVMMAGALWASGYARKMLFSGTFQSLEKCSKKSSNVWKFVSGKVPIIGTFFCG